MTVHVMFCVLLRGTQVQQYRRKSCLQCTNLIHSMLVAHTLTHSLHTLCEMSMPMFTSQPIAHSTRRLHRATPVSSGASAVAQGKRGVHTEQVHIHQTYQAITQAVPCTYSAHSSPVSDPRTQFPLVWSCHFQTKSWLLAARKRADENAQVKGCV